jgi:hypothetical protein
MQDEYDIDVEALPDDAVVETASEPDPHALKTILAAALDDIESAGGREAHLLRTTIGKTAFDMLPTRQSTSQAWRAWRDATPATKPQATRMLAIAIAQAADKPHLVDRIVREINDMDPFASDATTPSPKTTPVKAQNGVRVRVQKTLPRASTKVAPRDSYLDMLKLATKSDVTQYVRARRDA